MSGYLPLVEITHIWVMDVVAFRIRRGKLFRVIFAYIQGQNSSVCSSDSAGWRLTPDLGTPCLGSRPGPIRAT